MGKTLEHPTVKKMPKTPFLCPLFLIVLFFLHTQLKFCSGASVSGLNPVRTGELDAMAKRACSGRIGECSEAELEMDSESNRRVLLMRRYISYDTLKRDLVPCDEPGVSYYDCRGPGVANNYHRGCEEITRCARGD